MDTNDEFVSVREPEAPPEPRPKAPPIESRFLFVDVAAMRAKQLRRGALPRIASTSDNHRPLPHKAERIAIEEVRENLVWYELPEAAEE